RLLYRIPHRETLVGGTALARRDPAHHLGAVFLAAQGVKGALAARDPLHEHAGRAVDEDAHAAPRSSAATFEAPEPISPAVVATRMLMPLRAPAPRPSKRPSPSRRRW